MKTIASLAFAVASSIGACIGATSLASLVLADPAESRPFETATGPDLWIARPIQVDVSQQNFERIPARLSSYVTNPTPVKIARNGRSPVRKSPTPQMAMSTAHLEWCTDRYRSYDPASNTYRSYIGQQRTCQSPYATRQPLASTRDAVDPRFVGYGMDNLRGAWCAARYRSYRAEDNTYQPYDGPRRRCDPPIDEVRLEASNI